jgi:hypothetical protein
VSDLNVNTHIPEDDLALFAMQLLSESEMATAAAHIATCPVCKSLLADLQGDLAIFALTSEPHTPPAAARESFLAQVAREKKFVAPKPTAQLQQDQPHQEPILAQRSSKIFSIDEAPPRRSVAPLLAWTGWAIAAAVGVFAFLQFQQREQLTHTLSAEQATLSEANAQAAHAQEVLGTLTDAGAIRVSLHQPGGTPKPEPEAHATYVAGKGSLVLIATHLDQLADNKTYELWLLPAEKGLAPIPAGLFRPDSQGSATLVMPALPKGVEAKGFGVTIEADGGAKTPTAPIVLAGF